MLLVELAPAASRPDYFSAALACRVASASQAASGHTAAELPPNTLSAKAST
jgi:hypothetical protein